MKLTKTQTEYAVRRIEEVVQNKIQEDVTKAGLKEPSSPPELSYEQKWKLIFAGKARCQDSSVLKYRSISVGYWDFPEDKKQQAAYTKAKEVYNNAYAAIAAKWAVKKQEAMDKLYLAGDADAALTIINSL